jgi:uroporphyrinogen decarboxylase
MTKKQEFINSLLLKKNETCIPFWELEFHKWNDFSERKFIVGEDFVKLSLNEKRKTLHTNAETIADVCSNLGFSAVTVPGGYWELSPGHPAYLWLPDEYRYQQAKLIQDLIGNDVMVISNTGGVMAIPDASIYVDFSIQMMTNPEEIDEIAAKTFHEGIESIKKFRDLGIETFYTASDLADSHSPYFDAAQMERFIYPYLAKWAETIKNLEGYSILHCDGNINPYMDNIASSGINGLQAIDPTANMNLYSLQQTYSQKLCLCGNLDLGLLVTGKPEQIYEEVKSMITKCKPVGSYVFGCSNAVQDEVPKENYLALVQAYRESSKMDSGK